MSPDNCAETRRGRKRKKKKEKTLKDRDENDKFFITNLRMAGLWKNLSIIKGFVYHMFVGYL
jgi:hypothetical protein